MTLQPGNKLGAYEIVEKVGAGGMGAVYKGYQTALGRYVAIKVLPPQTAGDPAFAERFAIEARAIGKLRHPNIVTAFDFAHDGEVAFLVSEFIDGGTLADQLGAPLPLDYVVQALTPIAAALDYAHARGIVHRDIKPQNVLMTHDGTPVLTDFGLAKIVGPGSGITQAGSLMGTAEYIAPECASGAEVAGPAADQYALGLIAYQMLTGRHPFPADNPLSALMAHVHKPVPLPSSLGVTLPPTTEAALLRSLAKRPEERFARSSDFVKALAGSAFISPSAASAAATLSTPPVAPSQPPAQTPSEPQVAPLLTPSAMIRPVEPATRAPSTPPAPAAERPSQMFPGRTLPAADVKKSRPWWKTWRVVFAPPAAILGFLIVIGLLQREAPGQSAGRATATVAPSIVTLTLPATQNGSIATATESDVYRFVVIANKDLQVELRLGTLADGGVTLLDAANQSLASENAVGNSRTITLSYHIKDAGTYHVVVRGLRNSTGTYQLAITTK